VSGGGDGDEADVVVATVAVAVGSGAPVGVDEPSEPWHPANPPAITADEIV
jgi:hypothetical protein